MFQYALGRALAKEHGVPLVLDASLFNAEGWAEVSHFLRLPIRAKVIRRFSIPKRALRKFTGRHPWEFRGIPVLKEPDDDHSFDPAIAHAPADCMLSGFFQTPRYFEAIAGELRMEFRELLASQAAALPGMGAPGSVAVHVRRGDYLHHPAMCVCDEEYYGKSIDEMRARVAEARFYIFSDDPAWCRANFSAKDMEVIDSGAAAANPLHDLRLMSLASHHIIANSSYSWWAAWIANNPGQQVIMPERWFTSGIKAPIDEKRWQ